MTHILIEYKPSPMKLEILNVEDWPVVHKPVGMHPSSVTASETYYIEEGDAEITVDGEEPVRASRGDLLTIMPGKGCIWHVKSEMTMYKSDA
ncbi:MAG: cupin domain-containing protein [Gammaproteobacteria bacterium]|nr:cupin domain-containing protein [Gammaproteobacteria bacterium]